MKKMGMKMEMTVDEKEYIMILELTMCFIF